jgi:hypothetical protein
MRSLQLLQMRLCKHISIGREDRPLRLFDFPEGLDRGVGYSVLLIECAEAEPHFGVRLPQLRRPWLVTALVSLRLSCLEPRRGTLTYADPRTWSCC